MDQAQAGANDARTGALSRRALLARAAAGTVVAGAAWSAPAVLSFDAAAAAVSCAQSSRLDWSTQSACSSPGSVVVGGVTVTIAPSGTGVGDNARVRHSAGDSCGFLIIVPNVYPYPRGLPSTGSPGPLFNQADGHFYALTKNAGAANIGVTFGFGVAVNGVSFAIGDIDLNDGFGSRYTDVVSLTATDGSGSPLSAAQVASNISVAKGSNPPSGSNPFMGTATLVTDSSATVVVTFNIPIRSVTVTFSNAAGSPQGPQWIGISDLLWCPP